MTTKYLFEPLLKEGKLKDYDASDAAKVESIYLEYNVLYQEEKPINIVYSTYDHPFVFGNFYITRNAFNINEEYFEKNKKEAIDKIIEICANTKSENFAISDTNLITSDVVYMLANNKNIKNLRLGNKSDPYTLSKEEYQWFKKCNKDIEVMTDKIDPKLDDNFDPIIGLNKYKNLIGFYNYTDLTTSKFLNISSIKWEDIPNLKYINKDTKISFTADIMDLDLMFAVIKELYKIDKNFNIDVGLENKKRFNDFIFSIKEEIPDFDLTLFNTYQSVNIKDYVRYEKKLYDMIKGVENLSPFEKYLFAYNKVKQFKKYKESDNNPRDSRNLYKILDNDYIVCVGFSILLQDLLTKLGIESYTYDINVDTTFDNVKADAVVISDDIVIQKGEGHQRVMVHINDPKYNIDGYYTSDPTWDNNLEKDFYNYALMTGDELRSTDRYTYLNFTSNNSVHDLFDSKSFEEFFRKVNYYLDRDKYSTNDNARYREFFRNVQKTLKNIDSNFLKEVTAKFGDIGEYGKKWSRDEISDIMSFLGGKFMNMGNNPIDYEKYNEALTVLYRDIYRIENYQEKVEETLKYNDRAQEKLFPLRTKETDKGITTELDSTKKFRK